jgi:hypothetical protein
MTNAQITKREMLKAIAPKMEKGLANATAKGATDAVAMFSKAIELFPQQSPEWFYENRMKSASDLVKLLAA